jgi:hypothetical protein
MAKKKEPRRRMTAVPHAITCSEVSRAATSSQYLKMVYRFGPTAATIPTRKSA